VNELPVMNWSNQNSPNRGTAEIQFFLVYGAEAALPLEVAKGSLRVIIYDKGVQDQPSMMTLIW
jgi:hypothetical protein